MGKPYPKDHERDATMRFIEKHKLWCAVATECGIRPAAVRLWRRVPPLRVPAVEKATGRSRRFIRPDLYT
jgi:hypothetical protein